MNILIIQPQPTPFDSLSVREKPSGGTEKAAIFLGEAFVKLGHTVEWATTADEARRVSSEMQERWDVVITQVAELLEHFPMARKVWWSHHFADQPVTQTHAPFVRCFADRVVSLSQCHHDDLLKSLKIPSTIIGHGVWTDELSPIPKEGKDPHRLIYASTPFRGLEKIPALFREIRRHEPRATIAICSSMATYGTPERDNEFQATFDELATIEGVELLGSLNQDNLYREFARASVFLYPCIWPETYCIALDEAIAHGCLPITSGMAALGERCVTFEDGEDHSLIEAVEDTFQGFNPCFVLPDAIPRDWLDVARQWEEEVLA